MAEVNGRSRERKINLAALRKQDKYAGSILDTASSVAHYRFEATTEKWEKTEFEGSLFVYSRNEKGVEVAMMIMNRLKKENLLIKITTAMEFKPQEPFLLCRTPTEIIGIWFYDETECARLTALLSRIAELAGDEKQLKSEIDEALDEVEQKEEPKVDVLQMFTKAKVVYDRQQHQKDNTITKSASMSKFIPNEQKLPTILKRTNSFPESINEGGLTNEEGLSMKVNSRSNDSETLMKLLQGNKKQVRKSRSRTLSYGEQVESNTKRPLEKQSFSRAGDLAIREESKLYNEENAKPAPSRANIIDVAMLEAGVLSSLNTNTNLETDNPVNTKESRNGIAEDAGADTKINKQSSDKDSLATLSSLLNPATLTPTKSGTAKPAVGRGKGLASILNFMEPKAADKSAVPGMQVGASPKGASARRELQLAMKFPEPPSGGLVSSLMSPMQFKAGAKTIGSQDAAGPTELTQLNKQQFRDAFVNLLQNDETFLEKLHSSYVSLCSRPKR